MFWYHSESWLLKDAMLTVDLTVRGSWFHNGTILLRNEALWDSVLQCLGINKRGSADDLVVGRFWRVELKTTKLLRLRSHNSNLHFKKKVRSIISRLKDKGKSFNLLKHIEREAFTYLYCSLSSILDTQNIGRVLAAYHASPLKPHLCHPWTSLPCHPPTGPRRQSFRESFRTYPRITKESWWSVINQPTSWASLTC